MRTVSVTPTSLPAATIDTFALMRALFDELSRCGLQEACTSPGSRSTPLVLALDAERRVRSHSHIDERTAGFAALGLARATGRPAAVMCTSGTAAAELAPAVIEAHHGRVGLIVLTADRPPELREVGAGQAIDQHGLYGGAVRWFFDVGTHEDAGPARVRWLRALACRAWWTAAQGPPAPGPVHLNLAFREPLVPSGSLPRVPGGRRGGGPWLTRTVAPAARPEELERALEQARDPLLVAGSWRSGTTDLGAVAARFAAARGMPLLADPLSGARRGPAAVAHYDALLRDRAFARERRPDLVIRVGELPTSRPLRTWLGELDARQIALDPDAAWLDPDAALSDIHPVDPTGALRALTPRGSRSSSWAAADDRAAEAIAAILGEELSEPALAAELGRSLPSAGTLLVASSMPIRDVETFMTRREDPPRVLANRGANGIDGTVATAMGIAAAGAAVTLLIGDVALAHDAGALLSLRRHPLALQIVLLDNDGGGIFDFLPVAGAPAARRALGPHITTPPALDVPALAAAAGLPYQPVHSLGALRGALAEQTPGLWHVRTDRAENVALHRRVWAAVAQAAR